MGVIEIFKFVLKRAALLLVITPIHGYATTPTPTLVSAKVPEIWFTPRQPHLDSHGNEVGASDYFRLFSDLDSWEFVAKRVAVFKVYPELLRNASDEQLRLLIAGLSSRKIPVGLETPVLVNGIQCSPSSVRGRWMIGPIRRFKRLGGVLSRLTMVGPLVDGHITAKPGSCLHSIAEVAADAASTVAIVRSMYPNIEIGEIEPVGEGSYPGASDIESWLHQFQLANGRPISFFHADVMWNTDWSSHLRSVAGIVKRSGVKFGVIYNGTARDMSDESFATDVLKHAGQVEDALGGPPDQVVFQSWQTFPRLALPDSDSSTMTGVVRSYLAAHSNILPR